MRAGIEWYRESIITALESLKINTYYAEQKTVTASSNVSSDNVHRPFLESVRNDLFHFDEEKKVRIIYNVESYLDEHDSEDPELLAVLKRILVVVQQYKFSGSIILSPTKPIEKMRISLGHNDDEIKCSLDALEPFCKSLDFS